MLWVDGGGGVEDESFVKNYKNLIWFEEEEKKKKKKERKIYKNLIN